MASSQVTRGPDSGGAGEASAPPASCEATLKAAPTIPGDPSVGGDLVLPGIALEPVVVTLLDPAVAGVKEDPVVEKVERVGIALAQCEGLVRLGEVLLARHEQRVGMVERPEPRLGRAGHDCVGVAVEHLLQGLRLVVELTQRRLGKDLLRRDASAGAAPAGDGDGGIVERVERLEAAGELLAGGHLLAGMGVGGRGIWGQGAARGYWTCPG